MPCNHSISLSLSIPEGLYDEERPQKEKLDRALVRAASQFNIILCERGPHWEEGHNFIGPSVLCGGKSSTRPAFKPPQKQTKKTCCWASDTKVFPFFSLYQIRKERETSLSSNVQTKASRSVPQTKWNGKSGSRVRQFCSGPVDSTYLKYLIQYFKLWHISISTNKLSISYIFYFLHYI